MEKGDIVRHYSWGKDSTLGIVMDIFEIECRVWYPAENYTVVNYTDDFEVVCKWEDLNKKLVI